MATKHRKMNSRFKQTSKRALERSREGKITFPSGDKVGVNPGTLGKMKLNYGADGQVVNDTD